MFMDPRDTQEVAALDRGAFALPRLDFHAAIPALEDGGRLQRSIRGMQANMRGKGFDAIADLLDAPKNLSLPERMDALVGSILADMQACLAAGLPPASIDSIFHRVHLWGGNTGRNIYVMGGGFEKNYDRDAYSALAREAACSLPAVDKVPRIQAAAARIRRFGVSFATKHASFWSRAAGTSFLPIYDNVIAQGCLGHPWANWSHYQAYVGEMARHAGILGIDVAVLERAAFNFFSSAEGGRWIEARRR